MDQIRKKYINKTTLRPESYTNELFSHYAKDVAYEFYWPVRFENRSANNYRSGECDFLAICKQGILVVEVKGGNSIEVKNNSWRYFLNGKESYQKKESPFDQANRNIEAIKNYLEEVNPKLKNLCFAKSVILPFVDAEKINDDLQGNRDIVFDINHKEDDFAKYIDTCFRIEKNKVVDRKYIDIDEELFNEIKKTLFPNQNINLTNDAEARDALFARTYQSIYGPKWDDHYDLLNLKKPPNDFYLTGILHQRSQTETLAAEKINDFFEDDEVDLLRIHDSSSESSESEKISNRGFTDEGQDHNYEDRTALHSNYLPSSMGLSFFVDNLDLINIEIGFSTYEPTGEIFQQIKYLESISIDLKSDLSDPIQINTDRSNNDLKVSLYLKKRKFRNKYFIEVFLANDTEGISGYRGKLYQCGLRIKLQNAIFLPQDNENDSQDDFGLFSKQKTYAIGRGVAVNWVAIDQSPPDYLETEYLPHHDVLRLESTKVDSANLTFLNLANLENLIEVESYTKNLYQLAEKYQEHLEPLSKAQNLNEKAKLNISNAINYQKRICLGIKLLNDNPDALRSFQLMNRVFYENFNRNNEASWRGFQLAFCLASLPGIVDPVTYKDERELVDLIWFPTGGGKTEAYLALICFSIILRRMKNPTNIGVNVIMRYTLRLLVQDQFLRLSKYIAQLEKLRIQGKENNLDLGDVPISLGLWVGQASSPKSYETYQKEEVQNLPKLQLQECPLCNKSLTEKIGNKNHGYFKKEFKLDHAPQCVNEKCFYYKRVIPIYQFEEDIFEKQCTVIVGTVDNFAKLSWEGYETHKLFNINKDDGKPLDNDPPDIIIQDELHLISGPLGTLVGLYDQLVRDLCSKKYPVKVIASTATIRNAYNQISKLYGGRSCAIAPPPELHWGESFFMQENQSFNKSRRYVGVMYSARSAIDANAMLQANLMQAAQFRPDVAEIDYKKAIDPFWTLVMYFNSIRELAYALSSKFRVEGLLKIFTITRDIELMGSDRYFNWGRKLTNDSYEELTGRKDAQSLRRIRARLDIKKENDDRLNFTHQQQPIDVLLATNMISVGIDVPRLGLMMVNGFPKSNAEYIQATSRVGRETSGLIFMVYNGNKSRDRSHYESFKSYHESLYKHVEPTSVTPFSSGAIAKALAGLVAAYLRHFCHKDRVSSYTVNDFRNASTWVLEQVKLSATDNQFNFISNELKAIQDRWDANSSRVKKWGAMSPNRIRSEFSFIEPFHGDFSEDLGLFQALTSLRNVDTQSSVDMNERTPRK